MKFHFHLILYFNCATPAFTEMSATYVNSEGRVQMTQAAVQPKGQAKEGWAIFRALSASLGQTLPYDSADALRAVLREEIPSFAGLGFAPAEAGADALKTPVEGGKVASKAPDFAVLRGDFYLTNAIARASKTMAECSLQKQGLETAVAAE